MIEILNIILQFIIFLSLFSFPFCLYKKKIFLIPDRFIIDGTFLKIGINIIIHANILLVISFINIDTQLYFYLIVLLSILSNVIFIYNDEKFDLKFNDIVIFLVFIIFTLGFFFKIATDLKLEWDGLNHWFPKALNFFNDLNIKNLNEMGFSEYPHLGPYIWAFFWKNSYLEYEYFGRLFYVYFYVTSLFCVFENQFNKNIILKIIFIFLLSIITFDLYLFGGYQGYLIFSILIILSKLMYEENFKGKIVSRPLLFYFFIIYIFHLIIWFKDEGIFYYIFTLILFIFFLNINKKYFLYLLCISFVVLQVILQKFLIGTYGFQAEIIHEGLFENLKPNIFMMKLLLISKYIFISIIKYKLWIINLFSLSILFLFFKKEFSKLKMWFYILVINFLFIYAIYIHTPYDLEFLLKVTLDRVMFHTSGLYLIFTVVLLEKISFRKDN